MITTTLDITHDGGPAATSGGSRQDKFLASSWSTEHFSYKDNSEKLLVNLGPKLYHSPSSAPAYGFNGIISGFITLSGSQAHIASVVVKVSFFTV
jgi:hypothetical protein